MYNALHLHRKLIRVVAWNAAFTLLLLLPIELWLRYRSPSIYQRTFPGKGAPQAAFWVEADTDLGWTVTRRPDWPQERVRYRVNRQGFRHDADFDALPRKTSERRRAAVLGDSFTFGVHLPEHETLPAFLGDRLGPGWEMINLAVPGYGIDQMVLAYEKYRAALRADVVLLVFIDEDIERVFEAFRHSEGLAKPSFDLVGERLVERRETNETVFDLFLRKSRIANTLYSRWYRPRESMRIAEAFLHRLSRLVASEGGRLVLVRYPRIEHFAGKMPYTVLPFEKILTAAGVTYVEPFYQLQRTPDLSALYFAADRHPTGEGNRLVAEVVQSFWPR